MSDAEEGETKRAIFSVFHGEVVVTWPEKLDIAECNDLHEWFSLIVRNMRRTAIELEE